MRKSLDVVRLAAVWLLISIPCIWAGYVYEAGSRAFKRGRRLLEEDVYGR